MAYHFNPPFTDIETQNAVFRAFSVFHHDYVTFFADKYPDLSISALNQHISSVKTEFSSEKLHLQNIP